MENDPNNDPAPDPANSGAAREARDTDNARHAETSIDSKSRRRKPSPFIFMSAGIEFTAVTAALAGLGWWLDGKWGTDPWLMIIGLAMGLIGGTYKLWRLGRIFFR